MLWCGGLPVQECTKIFFETLCSHQDWDILETTADGTSTLYSLEMHFTQSRRANKAAKLERRGFILSVFLKAKDYISEQQQVFIVGELTDRFNMMWNNPLMVTSVAQGDTFYTVLHFVVVKKKEWKVVAGKKVGSVL